MIPPSSIFSVQFISPDHIVTPQINSTSSGLSPYLTHFCLWVPPRVPVKTARFHNIVTFQVQVYHCVLEQVDVRTSWPEMRKTESAPACGLSDFKTGVTEPSLWTSCPTSHLKMTPTVKTLAYSTDMFRHL